MAAPASTDAPVEVQGITTATQVSAGGQHTCAVLSSGQIECWGANNVEQLGHGKKNTDTPVKVKDIKTATQVSAGTEYTCAVLSSGHIQCWGENRSGQLGNVTSGGQTSTPVEVQGITTATQVTAGHDHTCAALSSGHVQCWGENFYGELGNGTRNSNRTLRSKRQGISTATR